MATGNKFKGDKWWKITHMELGMECGNPNYVKYLEMELNLVSSELAYKTEGLQKISDKCPICINRGKCNICIADEYLPEKREVT